MCANALSHVSMCIPFNPDVQGIPSHPWSQRRGQATRDSLGQEEVVHLKGELTLKKISSMTFSLLVVFAS